VVVIEDTLSGRGGGIGRHAALRALWPNRL